MVWYVSSGSVNLGNPQSSAGGPKSQRGIRLYLGRGRLKVTNKEWTSYLDKGEGVLLGSVQLFIEGIGRERGSSRRSFRGIKKHIVPLFRTFWKQLKTQLNEVKKQQK